MVVITVLQASFLEYIIRQFITMPILDIYGVEKTNVKREANRFRKYGQM